MKPTLYSNDSSYYSMTARLVLAEKGVAYELHPIDIQIKLQQLDPAYARVQPNMTVPTLTYEGKTLDQSRDILNFVNQQFPGPDLCPAADAAAIQASLDTHYSYSIEDLTMGMMAHKGWFPRFMIRHYLNRCTRKCLRLIRAQPALRAAYEQKITLENERRQAILSKHNNFAAVMQQAIAFCDELNAGLAHHDFIATNQYSLADVVWTVFLGRLFMIKLDHLVTERPRLLAYWHKMQARPSYQQASLWVTLHPGKIFHMLTTLFMR